MAHPPQVRLLRAPVPWEHHGGCQRDHLDNLEEWHPPLHPIRATVHHHPLEVAKVGLLLRVVATEDLLLRVVATEDLLLRVVAMAGLLLQVVAIAGLLLQDLHNLITHSSLNGAHPHRYKIEGKNFSPCKTFLVLF